MSAEDKYSAFRMALTDGNPTHPSQSQPEPEFDDFKGATGAPDEFADFSQAFDSGTGAGNSEPLSESKTPAFKPFNDINQAVGINLSAALQASASDDKIAALKALVQDKNLYNKDKLEKCCGPWNPDYLDSTWISHRNR